jgi:hypothetical protein
MKRSGPLKRTPMRRAGKKTLARGASFKKRGKSTATPTLEEKSWMAFIKEFGCIACLMDDRGYVEPAVHHIIDGQRRLGHLFTLPLCQPGHHMDGGPKMISRHPYKARFEAEYGSEMDLLKTLREDYLQRYPHKRALYAEC